MRRLAAWRTLTIQIACADFAPVLVCALPIHSRVRALKTSLMSNCLTGFVRPCGRVAATLVASLKASEPVAAASKFTWRDIGGVSQFADRCPPAEDCTVKQSGVSTQVGATSGSPLWTAAHAHEEAPDVD